MFFRDALCGSAIQPIELPREIVARAARIANVATELVREREEAAKIGPSLSPTKLIEVHREEEPGQTLSGVTSSARELDELTPPDSKRGRD
jgi:hypothetical protein